MPTRGGGRTRGHCCQGAAGSVVAPRVLHPCQRGPHGRPRPAPAAPRRPSASPAQPIKCGCPPVKPAAYTRGGGALGGLSWVSLRPSRCHVFPARAAWLVVLAARPRVCCGFGPPPCPPPETAPMRALYLRGTVTPGAPSDASRVRSPVTLGRTSRPRVPRRFSPATRPPYRSSPALVAVVPTSQRFGCVACGGALANALCVSLSGCAARLHHPSELGRSDQGIPDGAAPQAARRLREYDYFCT